MKRITAGLLACALLVAFAPGTFADVIPVEGEDYEVTFLVDLNCAILNGEFDPAEDDVVVTGNHASLGGFDSYVTMNRVDYTPVWEVSVLIEEFVLNNDLDFRFGVVIGENAIWDNEIVTVVLTGDEPDSDNDGYLELETPLVMFGNYDEPCLAVDLELTLGCWPLIPPEGGMVLINASIEHDYPTPTTFDVWTVVELPNGDTIPYDSWTVTLQPGVVYERTFAKYVGPQVQPGDYEYRAYTGYPDFDLVYGSDYVAFTKDNDIQPGPSGDANDAVALQPLEYAIGSAYPNPFNPETSVSVSLPETSQLTVNVFNVQGQQVGTVAEGTFQAGHHTLSFNGADLPSGLYFIHAQVPGQLDEVRRVTLLK